jgi:hypothetical protein
MTATLYKPQDKSPPDFIEQGDILQPTEQLLQLLRTYHPYYAEHRENKYFVVLTQSCDLVMRDGGPCNARYVTLAPVRPLPAIIDREFGSKLKALDDGQHFASHRIKGEVERFLARLFNNNEPGLFYLEEDNGAKVPEAMCVVLALPIALKAEHYPTFLAARVVGIDDTFQAKLGWKLGEIYSRVGTPDLYEGSVMTGKVNSVAGRLALWLATEDIEELERLIAIERQSGARVDAESLHALLTKLPKKKERAVEVVLGIATALGLVKDPSPERFKFRKMLNNDRDFSALF